MATSMPSQLALTTEQRIVEVLRERILEGQLTIGERLRQDTVSHELGVSSTPVREAFRRLEAEGLLTIASHKGAIVRDLAASERVEVLEMLRLVEAHNIAFAIPRATPEIIEAAADAQAEMRDTFETSRWATLNRRFHGILASPSGKPRALALLRENLNLGALQIREDMSDPQRRAESLDEHDRILEAYAARDIEACQAATRHHTTMALDRLVARQG